MNADSFSAEDPATAWKRWHEHRVATVSAPYGPLSLTGTLLQTPSGGPPGSPTTRKVEFPPFRGTGASPAAR